MEYKTVAAMARGNVIGNDLEIPWSGQYPGDVKHFKNHTLLKPVIMGRLTYESLPEFKITGRNETFKRLSNRTNIVLSRNKLFEPLDKKVHAYDNFDFAMGYATRIAEYSGADEVCCAGGKQIYELFEKYATVLELTRIDKDFEGDVKYEIDFSKWELVNQKASKRPEVTYETYKRAAED